MRRARIWLSVLVIGGGLLVMALRPRDTATVAPWIGAAVGYWFRGSDSDERSADTSKAASGCGAAGA
jgi:hypothetical protein